MRHGIIANLRDPSDISLVFPECHEGIIPRFKVWSRFKVNGAEGFIIVLGLTGAEVMDITKNHMVRNRILDAVRYGHEQFGIELFGLTSLTSSVTMQGEWIRKKKPEGTFIIHGDSYAASLGGKGIDQICKMMNWKLRDLNIAVLGATGLIGKAMATVLSQRRSSLTLIGRNENRLKKLKDSLSYPDRAFISTELKSMNAADIIITATSNPSSILQSSHIKKDSPVFVYEVSVPPNVSYETYTELRKVRPNLIKIDGSMAAIPGVDLGVEISGVPSGITFSCWAETMMQAMENDHSDHTGEITVSHMVKTLAWGDKYGFTHSPFTCFGKPITVTPAFEESRELLEVA